MKSIFSKGNYCPIMVLCPRAAYKQEPIMHKNEGATRSVFIHYALLIQTFFIHYAFLIQIISHTNRTITLAYSIIPTL